MKRLLFTLLLLGASLQARPPETIPNDTPEGLLLCGYQGWFNTPGDGSGRGWRHYRGTDGQVRRGLRRHRLLAGYERSIAAGAVRNAAPETGRFARLRLQLEEFRDGRPSLPLDAGIRHLRRILPAFPAGDPHTGRA